MVTCISKAKSLVTALLMLSSLSLTSLMPSSGHAFELVIGTGEAGSFTYFAGKAVCRTLHKADPDTSCRALPTENETDNLTNLLNGSLDLALVNSKTIHDAFHQSGLFQYVSFNYDQLRLLMPLYRMPISLYVRQDAEISELKDLAGKKVNAGAPFSLQNMVFREIMNREGWREESFSLFQTLSTSGAQDYLALDSGSVQAMLHIGMHPESRIERGLKFDGMELIGISGPAIDRLLDNDSGFYRQTIPADSYPALNADITTLSLETLLITSADLDEQTVALVLDAIHTARRQLQMNHPAFLQQATDVETLNESYLHPHPAAVLFFQTNRSRL